MIGQFHKIGIYWYQEISEKRWQMMMDDREKRNLTFCLIDYDGEPIKFFKRVKGGR